MIIVKKWFCRLGNNMNQLINIMHIAFIYKHNIVFKKKHKMFDVSIIENYFSKYDNKEIIIDKRSNFFFEVPSLDYTKISEEDKKETIKILKESFVIKNIYKLPENYLVIHIRSGDIFQDKFFNHPKPPPSYIPPPLSYYTKYIEEYNYKNIIIVCEDKVNPVVDSLLKIYKNAIYTKNSLEEDIKIIMGATNVLWSIGSFVPKLLLISDHIKNVYHHRMGRDYNKVMRPWRNTEEQRKYMLTYK